MDSSEQHKNNVETLQTVLSLLENDQAKKALELLQSSHFVDELNLIQRQIEAEILVSLNEHNRAECSYLAILREYPQNTDTKFALSQLYQKNGRFSQADQILDEVIEIEPNHFMAWNNKGNIQRSLKNIDLAITCYKKSLEIEADYSIAMNNLCLLYSETGQYNEALEIGLKALETNPQTIPVYEMVHHVYMQMNNQEEAANLLNMAISQCGEDSRLMCLRAS